LSTLRNALCFCNRQRTRRINLRLLRKITSVLLTDLLDLRKFEVGVNLVGKDKITQLNQRFLKHAGSTDVITFDYSDDTEKLSSHSSSRARIAKRSARLAADRLLRGEIFISIDDSVVHARRFHTSWQAELVRYIIHGLLHLQGYDDVAPSGRFGMRRQEDRLLHEIKNRFSVSELAPPVIPGLICRRARPV
jgi:probable rRNA maturation factor